MKVGRRAKGFFGDSQVLYLIPSAPVHEGTDGARPPGAVAPPGRTSPSSTTSIEARVRNLTSSWAGRHYSPASSSFILSRTRSAIVGPPTARDTTSIPSPAITSPSRATEK